MKKEIKIEGMSCDHCVRHVEEALKEVAGVSGVRVDLQGKNAVVELRDTVSNEVLKTVVEEVGYDVTGINDL
ncbi:MAG TPA: cation transporter [Bacillota bacterium]|nr:cation transporter [Bacillota bacterium]